MIVSSPPEVDDAAAAMVSCLGVLRERMWCFVVSVAAGVVCLGRCVGCAVVLWQMLCHGCGLVAGAAAVCGKMVR